MDDGSPIGLILMFVLCLGGSFYFSGTEMAFSSVNRIRMRAYADDGDKRAARVLTILEQFDHALTALLIGNNVVNIACATIATILATNLWGSAGISIATLVTTVLLFMLGETLPKTLAKANSEAYAMRMAGSLQMLMRVLRPLVFVFDKVTVWLTRPLKDREVAPSVTEAELRDILSDAVEEGALDQETSTLVQSAIRYTDATVHDVLTPWKKVRKLSLDMPPEALMAAVKETRYSRLPVIDADGEVVGLLRIRKYLKETLRGTLPDSLRDILEPAHAIPVTTPVDALLPVMSRHKTHLVLVRDEWENVLGIVTVEDILERLVGDIYDEEDIQPAEGGDADAR